MASRLSYLMAVLLACKLSTATINNDDSLPEDDEDNIAIATFTLSFSISGNCSENWYRTHLLLFQDLLHHRIVNDINEECNNCGFTEDYIRDEHSSCRENTLAFGAQISNWFSSDYPTSALLELIEDHFNSNLSFVLHTESFASNNITFSIETVEVSNTVVPSEGSGLGSGDLTTGAPVSEYLLEDGAKVIRGDSMLLVLGSALVMLLIRVLLHH